MGLIRFKNNMVNPNNVVYQEHTLIELPHTLYSRHEDNQNYTLNPLHRLNTREQVRELRSANLCMTMSEIAKRVGVSRQRVFDILQEEGLPTKHYVSKKKANISVSYVVLSAPTNFAVKNVKRNGNKSLLYAQDVESFFSGIRLSSFITIVVTTKVCSVARIVLENGLKNITDSN